MRRLHVAGLEPSETEGQVPKTVGGQVVWADAAEPVTTALVPLTTSINGVPELVWDADNQLVFTEVPV